MSFVSPEFALLALLIFPLYWACVGRARLQSAFLLGTSMALYASWSWHFVLALLLYAFLIWCFGRLLARHPNALATLLTCLLASVFLVVVKYHEFLRETISALLQGVGMAVVLPAVDWVAPVGVSFFTFQAITYLVWVSKAPAQARSWPELVLFLSFWPTLFAGPILRAADFFAQRDRGAVGLPRQPHRALYLLLLGLVQKLVLAHWLAAQWVDPAFAYPEQHSGISTLWAMVAYSLQIFFDFAGYTCIVTGLALLLGYRLPINFQQPYLARNLQQFWLRWHMSLSSFIRDHIYIPLGGNRRGFLRMQLYLFISMVISGIWHGPSWTFVLWGVLHAVGVMVIHLQKRWGWPPLPKVLACALTFVFVTAAWVFFRAPDIATALMMFQSLVQGPGWTGDIGFSHQEVLLLGLIGLLFVLSPHATRLERACVVALRAAPLGVLLPLLLVFLSAVIALGPEGVPGFIYYQF